MKKTVFLLFIFNFLFIFPVFSQNQILLTSKEAQKLLNAPNLLDNKGKNIDISEVYRCSNPYVSDGVKGTYFIFSNNYELTDKSTGKNIYSSVVYVENDKDHKIIDFLNVSNDLYMYVLPDPKTVYGYEYVKFDSYGRLYISALNCVNQIPGIAVFFPGAKTTRFYPLPEPNLQIMDFEISEDGRYLLIQSGHKDKNKNLNPDRSNIYAYFLEGPLFYTSLFEFQKDHISQIHYNSFDHSFYFLAYYKDDVKETGAYIYTPQAGKKVRDCLNFYPSTEPGLSFFDFKNAVLVKDSTSQIFYATDYSSFKASPIYELNFIENTANLSVPVELEGIILQNQQSETIKNKFRKNITGIYIHSASGHIFNLKNKILSSYKNEKDYEEKLKKTLLNNSKVTSGSRLNSSYVKDFSLLLCIFIFALLMVSVLLVVLIIRIVKNRIGINPEQKLQIQEEEKAKISREIHDTVVQDLRAIRVQAESLSSSDLEAQKKLTDGITDLIVKMRNICYSLIPAEIQTFEEVGNSGVELISVIDTLCRQFYTKTNIPCSIQIEENFKLPSFNKNTSTHIIRVFQEILNNIEKHSYATKASVLIRSKTEEYKKYLVIFVIDDGIGCDLEKMEKQKRKNHFGIQNMKERMKQIGGQIEFFSMPDQGMKIKLVIEIEKQNRK